MLDNPKLVSRVVPELEAPCSSGSPRLEAPQAVTVNPLGIPKLDGRVCVQSQTCEHRILGVTEHAGPFNTEYSSS